MPISLKVKQTGAEGKQISVEAEPSASVRELKAQLVAESKIAVEEQRLVYKGQVLKDERSLESYGLASDHVLHLVRGRPVGGASSPSPAATTAPPAASNAAAPPFAGGPPPGGFPGMADLFGGGDGGGGGLGGDGLGGMADLMGSPAMQNMLNNPEVLRSIFQSNPAIRDLMERNPDLAQMLNNPQVLRESMQMASNPALMREHMRNADRAISNIESHPEGFNMLRRMYENVQEPLLNATTTGAGAGTDAPANPQASNPFASLFSATPTSNPAGGNSPAAGATPNSAPLPNPWNSAGGGAGQPQSQTAGGGATGNPVGGLGLGGGLPGLGGSLGAAELEQMQQMMQNPEMQRMMQQMMSSPGMMDMLMNQSPQLRAMTEANPQVREMLSNPEMMQRLMDPANMQAMMQMQQSMQQLNEAGFGSAFGLPSGGMDPSLLNAMMGGGAAAGVPAANPETQYATQLQALSDMGFSDRQANIRALQATAGNVNAAVDRLLSGL